MSDEERHIERLEAEFPKLSGIAFMAARKRVLDSGQSVLQSEQGSIYEVFPNGERILRGKIKPPREVVPGTKITIG